MSDLENRSFFAHFCSFALFERAIEQAIAHSLFCNERAIAHSLFCNEQMSDKLLNRSFAMSK